MHTFSTSAQPQEYATLHILNEHVTNQTCDSWTSSNVCYCSLQSLHYCKLLITTYWSKCCISKTFIFFFKLFAALCSAPVPTWGQRLDIICGRLHCYLLLQILAHSIKMKLLLLGYIIKFNYDFLLFAIYGEQSCTKSILLHHTF